MAEHVINHYDLMTQSGTMPAAYWPTAHKGWARYKGTAFLRTWDDVEAAHPGVQWATLGGKGDGPWFPADRIPAVQALKLTGDYLGKIGSSVRCPIGRPCEVVVSSGERWMSFHTCSRPAVEPEVIVRQMGGPVRGCKLHAAAAARREANDAARHAENAARTQRWKDQAGLDQASHEWAQRLADELGIRAEGHHHSDVHLRVLVEPERLYRQLVDLLGELRDLGLDEMYPFKQGEVEGR